ncbi:hypothetical protein Salat_0727000 [Sesamum alatum]|uniref:PB1-like domain-containing protein n=1 Tax=Sesamum alatum TaxID=300844 RepID=A0AAE2CV47_9LAMI|nr:hypothetical protein Salat_0727000 [Sesamum alatum]
MVLDDYADFDVWVGGVIEWVPKIRYVRGSRVWFPDVDKERIYYGDLIDMYVKAGGKGLNIVVYYCLPGMTLDNGIRLLNGDDGIRELIRAYKGLSPFNYFNDHADFNNDVVSKPSNTQIPVSNSPHNTDMPPSNSPHNSDIPCFNSPHHSNIPPLNSPHNSENPPSNSAPNNEFPPFNSAPNSDIHSNTELPEVYEGMQGGEPSEGGGEGSDSDSSASQCSSRMLEDLEEDIAYEVWSSQPIHSESHVTSQFRSLFQMIQEERPPMEQVPKANLPMSAPVQTERKRKQKHPVQMTSKMQKKFEGSSSFAHVVPPSGQPCNHNLGLFLDLISQGQVLDQAHRIHNILAIKDEWNLVG